MSAQASERHHGPFPAGRVPLSPARMWCPRGDLSAQRRGHTGMQPITSADVLTSPDMP